MAITTQLRASADEGVINWFEVSNSVVRPGESVTVTWWCQFEPGVGEATQYQGYPATVLFFEKEQTKLKIITNSVKGQFTDYFINPALCAWQQYAGIPFENAIWYVQTSNWDYGCNPEPSKSNPLWLYQYTWTPMEYLDDTAVITASIAAAQMALDVPALGKVFPSPAYTLWPIKVHETVIAISDAICFADCDRSDELNIEDFVCFQTVFATGDPNADCDDDGQLLIDDFICFQTAYAIGC